MKMENSFAQRDQFWKEIRENSRKLFSFTMEGKEYFSTDLSREIKEPRQENNKEITEILWKIPGEDVVFSLQFTLYKDFPYLEYETFLTNTGSSRSSIIEDVKMLTLGGTLTKQYYGEMIIKTLDLSDAGNRLKVSYYLGTGCTAHDFIRIDRRLYPFPGEEELHLVSNELSRSSERAMPFFRLDFDDSNGYDIGVGWSGSWNADFQLKCKNPIQGYQKMGNEWKAVAGMTRTHFRILPGETLRQVGFFIGFRKDISVRDFINIHRHFMIKHHAPYNSKGELIKPPVAMVSWGGVETENMKIPLSYIKKYSLPVDVHWIDAGWQGEDGPCPHFCDETAKQSGDWGRRVGNNRINTSIHPNGLSEITDFGREHGVQTLLWQEPERYHKNCESPLFQTHPEWFLDSPESSFVFDLGNPEACEYLTNWTLEFLEREKIEHYRVDENINFRPSWEMSDAPDRIGVHEMKHIHNLYYFWGTLRKARPDMFIDNCASGGRRLDYMLANYSFPLCQSDYECYTKYNYSCVHLENYFLNEVYPLHATLCWMPDDDIYAAFSGGCGTGIGCKRWNFPALYPENETDFDFDSFRRKLLAVRDMRDLLIRGNYYQLTKDAEDLSEFCAMQAHDPEKGEGFVLVFRRPETEEEEFISLLPEIDPEGNYEVKEFGKETAAIISGKELHYFRKNMPQKRSVCLLFYKKI